MKKFLVQASCVLVLGAVSCWADAMHGYCGGSSQCLDNNTNSPTTNNPPTDFGFTINKGGTGNLLMDILVPNNVDPNPSLWSFDLTGTLTGTATLFSTTPCGTMRMTFLCSSLAKVRLTVSSLRPRKSAMS